VIDAGVAAFIALVAALIVFSILSEKWRPLAVAALLSLISLPLYVYISQLPLNPVGRILLQFLAFMVILFAFYYVLAVHYSRIRGRTLKRVEH